MKIVLFCLSVFSYLTIQAQQDHLVTQFWNNYSHINPATSGLEYNHSAAILYRNQWDKVNGAPVDLSVNYNTLIGRGHHGIGVNYLYSQIAFNRTNDVNFNYNYQFILGARKGKLQKLSIGIAAGFTHFAMNPDWVPPTTLEDPTLPEASSDIAPNFNAGIAYKGSNLFTGIGVTHVIPATVSLEGTATYNTSRHYYAMGGYAFRLGSMRRFELKPQVLLRTDAVKLSADVNLLASLKSKRLKQSYWFGATYRNQDAVAFMVGWDINNRYRIGYSYDYTINKLSTISRGSHEVVLGFHMNRKPLRRKPCKCKKHKILELD